MCSSARGPAMTPSFVTWPTRTSTKPRRLARRISSCAAPRTWLTVPGALSKVSRYMVWIESTTTRPGASTRVERGDEVAHAAGGGQQHRTLGNPKALGAQPNLIDRLLAGDVG